MQIAEQPPTPFALAAAKWVGLMLGASAGLAWMAQYAFELTLAQGLEVFALLVAMQLVHRALNWLEPSAAAVLAFLYLVMLIPAFWAGALKGLAQ